MNVSLFVPCLVDQFHPHVAEATARILSRAGLKVHYPMGQTCCGQLLYKTGHWRQAKRVAIHFMDVFEGAEYIVAPSGSCVSMVKDHYPLLFRHEPDLLKRAEVLSRRIYELTFFLVNIIKAEDLGARLEGKAVYHDSCQVFRALGIHREPRVLLSHVRGLELVEMERADLCCGFGGPFSMQFPAISEEMVKEKASYVLATGAQYLIGAEISCLMNLGGYLSKQGHKVKTLHIAEVLNSV